MPPMASQSYTSRTSLTQQAVLEQVLPHPQDCFLTKKSQVCYYSEMENNPAREAIDNLFILGQFLLTGSVIQKGDIACSTYDCCVTSCEGRLVESHDHYFRPFEKAKAVTKSKSKYRPLTGKDTIKVGNQWYDVVTRGWNNIRESDEDVGDSVENWNAIRYRRAL